MYVVHQKRKKNTAEVTKREEVRISLRLSKLTGYFLHDSFFIVVTQRAAQLVIVHGRPILLDSPTTSNLKMYIKDL